MNCPSCNAPIKDKEKTHCEYCGVELEPKVIETIERIYHPINAEEAYKRIREIDGEYPTTRIIKHPSTYKPKPKHNDTMATYLCLFIVFCILVCAIAIPCGILFINSTNTPLSTEPIIEREMIIGDGRDSYYDEWIYNPSQTAILHSNGSIDVGVGTTLHEYWTGHLDIYLHDTDTVETTNEYGVMNMSVNYTSNNATIHIARTGLMLITTNGTGSVTIYDAVGYTLLTSAYTFEESVTIIPW